jgi:hypothetical protein
MKFQEVVLPATYQWLVKLYPVNPYDPPFAVALIIVTWLVGSVLEGLYGGNLLRSNSCAYAQFASSAVMRIASSNRFIVFLPGILLIENLIELGALPLHNACRER